MYADPQAELQRLNKRLIWVQVIEFPGCIMLGLGLYGKFNNTGKAFHPSLDNPEVITTLLALGGIVMAWGVAQFISIILQRNRVMQFLKSTNE